MYLIYDKRNERLLFVDHEPNYVVTPLIDPQPEDDKQFPSWPEAVSYAKYETCQRPLALGIWDEEIGKLLTIVFDGDVWALDEDERIPT